MSDLESRLTQIPTEYGPIVSLARQFANSGIGEEKGDVVLIGHEPDRARLAYAVTLFPGLKRESIRRYEQLHKIVIPASLKLFLEHINGASLCELSIYGIPPSMIDDSPVISRSNRNPFDLSSAVQFWHLEFEASKPLEFHFGSRDIGWSDQIGYFLRNDGSVISHPKRGTEYVSETWPSFEVWLRDEIEKTMSHRPYFLQECAAERKKAGRRHFRSKLLPWNWHRWLNQ